jgi:AraC-like DNA-binding protein
VRELLSLAEISVVPGAVPHRLVADLRGLELIDPRTFTQFVEFTQSHREKLARNVIRQAQLRPDGIVGAIIEGFSHIARLPYPERVFSDAESAVQWLGIDAVVGADLLSELATIRATASGTDELVRRLRDDLATSEVDGLSHAASRLGVSSRTFQRVLRDAGTTFRMEVRSAKLSRARSLLRETDRSLTWVAAELGFSSLQHFATTFRRSVGETPSAWRARHRANAVNQKSM